MDFWQSDISADNDKPDRFEAALLKVRPRAALGILFAVTLLILISVLYLPEAWRDSAWFAGVTQLSFKLAVALWIHADALSRGWSAARSMTYSCFAALSVLIVYPVYLVVSRGWKGALATGLRGLGVLLAALILVVVVALIMEMILGVPYG